MTRHRDLPAGREPRALQPVRRRPVRAADPRLLAGARTAAGSRPSRSPWLATARDVERHDLAATSTATCTRPRTGSSALPSGKDDGWKAKPPERRAAPARARLHALVGGRTCRPTATRRDLRLRQPERPDRRHRQGQQRLQRRLQGPVPAGRRRRRLGRPARHGRHPGRRRRAGDRAVDLGGRAPPGVARGRPGRGAPSPSASPSAAPSASPKATRSQADRRSRPRSRRAAAAVIPLRDANPTRRTPVVTIGLVVACLVVVRLRAGPARERRRAPRSTGSSPRGASSRPS